jgi:polar amino acid transport system substrate-binding protein
MRFFGVLLGLAAVASAGAARVEDSPTLQKIQQRGELRVGLEVGYMPFEMRDKTGEIIGFDVDIGKVLARRLGVKLTLVNVSWDGIIPALLTDKFDVLIGGMTITEERARRVAFSDPYMEIGQTVLISRRLAGQIQSYQDLNDPRYRIVSKLGTTGEIAARRHLPRAQLRVFETEADAAIEVRNGRADGFVYDFPFNAVFAAQHKDSLVNLLPPFTEEKLGWAVRQDDPAFLAWLNAALRDMKGDGTHQALVRKWFESDAWLGNVN